MIKSAVSIRLLFCLSAVFLAAISSALAEAGTESAAKAIADEIVAATRERSPLQPCQEQPIDVFFEGAGATELLMHATRGGYTPIRMTLGSPSPIGSLPPPIAEALNRLQRAGGRVRMQERKPDESLGTVVAWIASEAAALLSDAVTRLIGETLDAWASSGLQRYEALISYHVGSAGERIVHEVIFLCRD